jgi:mannose-6-phosphate isomerase
MNASSGTTLYPFSFHPLLKERVWGGRNLDRLYRKSLPSGVAIGESWEITDRPDDNSVIANGPLAGKNLHWLVTNFGAELLGDVPVQNGRFPLLIKILDAQEKLSLQVHPPRDQAAKLGGEPKTELWYIADARPGAELYVGLKAGTTRAEFEHSIRTGEVARCFHRVAVESGDAMFLPSGRVHALGAGLVIFEIQQNSDTTYRVFDWNRVGLDGKPRALHIQQSLASIAFDDFEPGLIRSDYGAPGPVRVRSLVRDPLFEVEVCLVETGSTFPLSPHAVQILGVLSGQVEVHHCSAVLPTLAGQFCLVPASLEQVSLRATRAASFLRVMPGPR